MARWQSLPIAGGSYADESRPFSTQDTVNYLVEKAERHGTRSSAKLRPVPGMTAYCDLGTNSPIRGMRNVEGRLLVVSGNTLFSVASNGGSTVRGTIPGIGRVSMSHNQIPGGNEVAIANGQLGYVYNTVTETLTQITDEGFPGSISFEYLDSYIMGVEPGRRFGFHSNLAAASDYNTLDRYEAEGSPDRLVGQIVTHREWWLCGERTIEPFADTGASTGTFQRQSGLVIERGVASAHCLSLLDNSVFWVGDDGIVYRANGYTPQRISIMPVEQALAQCDLSQCFSFTFEDEGHKVYYLTCPDGYTFGFDVASGEWHHRQSKGLRRWRINTLTKWNGKWIAGDYSNGKLYTLDWGVCSDDGDELERRRTLGVLHDNQNALIIDALAIVADTGRKSVSIASPFALKISGNLPGGTVGYAVDYSYTVSATGRPVSASVQSGALPAGLSLSSDGRVTGTTTMSGDYSWVVRVTDKDGNTYDLSDSATFADVLAAQLGGWKYLQILATDGTDYSASAFDDSGWATGTAPFGNATNHTPTNDYGTAPPAYDARFSRYIATQMDLDSRIWMRRTLTLSSVPAGGLKLIGFFDNNFSYYVNGVLVEGGGTPTNGGITATITADKFVAGDNVIAVKCTDTGSTSANICYFDFLLDVA